MTIIGVLSNPAFWLLTAIFLGGLAFAAVRCRDVVAPGYRVAYMIPWFLFFGCVCVGAYFHTGVTAIALAILAGTFFIPLNFLEGASRGGPK
jgi:hypothetical protein